MWIETAAVPLDAVGLLAVVAGAVGGLVALYKARTDKLATQASTRMTEAETRTGEADAGKTLVETALTLIVPMGERVTKLEEQNRQCEVRAAKYEEEIVRLTARVAELERVV